MKTIKTPWSIGSELWNPNIWVAMEKKKFSLELLILSQ
jgi:hypothetical protein